MIQQIKNGTTFGITLCITIFLVWAVYSAWNDIVASGDPLAAASWNKVIEHSVPAGAVMAFNLWACPTGWTSVSGAEWRFIVWVWTLWIDTYSLSDTGWSATHILTQWELPPHNHSLEGEGAAAITGSPVNNMLGVITGATKTYVSSGPSDNTIFNDESIWTTGSGQAHENRPPYLAFLYCQKD